ncbi:ABC transporter permease [Subtercola boreus]|uniref:ABC transporter permease n=1 Tax=Subtercola boreus TaxID=120213 RepID=A0A3E0W7K4_9MICO|nr:ABC transporter permease [Subtercola boreus]RFA17990.1 ABC transporter permease [Subtercola boreus]RFA18372.1 ABC transporter permease [Subtercola boreus]RFA24901.1 ABC transporter permease [Subtercola boreus]
MSNPVVENAGTTDAALPADAIDTAVVTGATASATSLRRRAPGRSVFRPTVWVPAVVALLVAGVLWEIIAINNTYLLPRLGMIGQAIITQPAFYLENAGVTLSEALIGLLIGFAAAFIVAVIVTESGVLRRAIMPLAVVLNVTPVVAIAPALVVAFGFGPGPKLIVTALITFFPILMNVITGLNSVSPPILQVFTTLRASRLEVLTRLRLPSSLPFVFAALKVVFPLSIVGAVVAEFSAPGAAKGLGTVISVASSNSRLAVVYAAILCLAIMGSILLFLVTLLEKRVLRWHESQLLTRR